MLALGAPGLLRDGAAGQLSAAAMGAAAAVLPDDLGERAMIGDTGAHALGAALGAAVVAGNGRAGLVAHAAALGGRDGVRGEGQRAGAVAGVSVDVRGGPRTSWASTGRAGALRTRAA